MPCPDSRSNNNPIFAAVRATRGTASFGPMMKIKALMTRQEAAAMLGIGLRTIDTLIASGDLPCVRIGRSVRFRPSALELFIESREMRRNPRRRSSRIGSRRSS